MACYKNETKHKCSKVVMVVSILAIVMGILSAAFGFLKTGGADALMSKAAKAADQNKDFDANKELGIPVDGTVGTMVIIGGIFCIIVGVFGGLTVKFKKPYFAVPFVGLSFVIALILLIGAFIALAPVDNLADEGCKFLKSKEGAGVEPAKIYTNIVDVNMCSDACKCDEAHKAVWETDAAKEIIAKSVSKRTVESFKWAPAGDGVFDTFKACYDVNSAAMEGQTSSDDQYEAAKAEAQKWMKDKGSKLLAGLEDLYDCASMCEPGLFYFSKSLSEGPATQDCLKAAVTAMSSNAKPAGAVALISALALIVAGIGGFPLCTGFNEKKDDPE